MKFGLQLLLILKNKFNKFGGTDGIRTRVKGFADLYLTPRPRCRIWHYRFLIGAPAKFTLWGKEEQHKTPLNLRYLITQISCGVDVSSDVVGAEGLEPPTLSV
jgi:hypothetical protein